MIVGKVHTYIKIIYKCSFLVDFYICMMYNIFVIVIDERKEWWVNMAYAIQRIIYNNGKREYVNNSGFETLLSAIDAVNRIRHYDFIYMMDIVDENTAEVILSVEDGKIVYSSNEIAFLVADELNNMAKEVEKKTKDRKVRGRSDWFDIWCEDKKSILETMQRNLQSDLDAGYNPNGQSVIKQKIMIANCKNDIEKKMKEFANMTEAEVNRYCYYALVRSGAIEG